MNIKHLEVKRVYYNDPENAVIQYRHSASGDWLDVVREPTWTEEGEYRIKPKTIRIGDIDVPEPVRKPLEMGQKYWVFYLFGSSSKAIEGEWGNDSIDARWLSRGLIHLTREAAELHAKALILVSGGEVDK